MLRHSEHLLIQAGEMHNLGGAPAEARTPATRLKRAVLYQLSYRRKLSARRPVCCYAKGYWSFRFCPALAALSVLGSIASPPTTYTADLSSLRSLTGRCPGAVFSGAGDPASNAEGERRNLLRPHAAYHSLFGGWLLLSLPSGFHANMVGQVGVEPTEGFPR